MIETMRGLGSQGPRTKTGFQKKYYRRKLSQRRNSDTMKAYQEKIKCRKKKSLTNQCSIFHLHVSVYFQTPHNLNSKPPSEKCIEHDEGSREPSHDHRHHQHTD